MAKAEAQVVDWLKSNIKRGWGEVESARVGAPVTPPEEAAELLDKAKAKKKAPAKKTKKKAPAEKAPE